MQAVNDSTKSAGYVETQKDLFVIDGSDNQFQDASRFLLNGLAPRGSFPLLACDYLEAMYASSGLGGYVGYRDYIATKSSVLLLEAALGIIMETVILIATEPVTPEEALDSQVVKFGSWTVDAANNIKATINKAYNEAEITRPGNEKNAKISYFNSDRQKIADGITD